MRRRSRPEYTRAARETRAGRGFPRSVPVGFVWKKLFCASRYVRSDRVREAFCVLAVEPVEPLNRRVPQNVERCHGVSIGARAVITGDCSSNGSRKRKDGRAVAARKLEDLAQFRLPGLQHFSPFANIKRVVVVLPRILTLRPCGSEVFRSSHPDTRDCPVPSKSRQHSNAVAQ
jgi:hypothetical protein